jgi:beta-mannosidase
MDDTGVEVDLSVDCWHWGDQASELVLEARLSPKNFEGPSYSFKQSITIEPGANDFGFSGHLARAKLWWPVDMGEPNLYWFECTLKKGDQVLDRYRSHWGARKVEMQPNADGPSPYYYNWQFVINGRPIWVKGANWCLTDAMLRMDRQRNKRIVELARHAHIQLFRVWGGGPIENDELYDLCDEIGVMVQQEFSMVGYHRLQNIPSIHSTDLTRHMVKRLRNRPSLVIWAGANEISGLGRIVEVLGRRCLELDGTRPFRRTCPYGGDGHWHGYWTENPLLDYRKLADGRIPIWAPHRYAPTGGPIAVTEFGFSSPANHETWKRIIPSDEWYDWPPKPEAVFIHHTPTFDYVHKERMELYASEFLTPKNLPDLIKGMQVAQGLGLRILIESMRARKPQTTATYFYKLTENYPACSWATIDYYGVPKRSHYDIREAHEPIHVMALFEDWSTQSGSLPLKIVAVNDTAETVTARVDINLIDGQLNMIETETMEVSIPVDRTLKIAEKVFNTTSEIQRPLFLLLDLKDGQKMIDRNWYYFDFVEHQGSLFNRPKASLRGELRQENGRYLVAIQNTGQVPAISVELHPGEASNTYYAEQSGLWLKPGEQIIVPLKKTEAVDGETRELKNLMLSAWNFDAIDLLKDYKPLG